MKLHEYQAKAMLSEFSIPVPKGGVATTPAEAKKIAAELGGKVAIKAQVYAGGRGKAGGIKVANTPEEAEKVTRELIGSTVKGLPVEKVLVEEQLSIEKEFYVGVIPDSSRYV